MLLWGFFRCNFKQSTSIMWVGLIQAVEGLKSKEHIFSKKKEFFLESTQKPNESFQPDVPWNSDSRLQCQLLTWISRLLTDLEILENKSVCVCSMVSVSLGNPNQTHIYCMFSQFSSVQSLSRVWLFATHESQHTRPPCPSPTPGVYSNPCP